MHTSRVNSPHARRPKVRNSEMDALVAACWDQGWWCVAAGTNHVKCFPPGDARMVPIPSTPSGARTRANKIAALRRSGLQI